MKAELKVSLDHTQVGAAMAALGLGDGGNPGEPGTVGFFEDTTAGTDLPLFRAGVVLRVRAKAGKNVKSTVKFRPGRMSQFGERWFEKRVGVRFEQDWGLKQAVLAASLDGEPRHHMPAGDRAVGNADSAGVAGAAGRATPAAFFDQEQRRLLARCAPLAVNLGQLTLAGPCAMTRWSAVPLGAGLEVDVERWSASTEFDFLELSVKVDLDEASAVRDRLLAVVGDKGLSVEVGDKTKTELLLAYFAGRLAA